MSNHKRTTTWVPELTLKPGKLYKLNAGKLLRYINAHGPKTDVIRNGRPTIVRSLWHYDFHMFISRETVMYRPIFTYDSAFYTFIAGENLFVIDCLDSSCKDFEAIFEEVSSHLDS